MNPRWYRSVVCPRKKRQIASPSAIRTICCFTRPRPSALEEEFHLHAGQLDDVVVLQRVRRVADRLAIDRRLLRAFHMRDEVAVRAEREHRFLHVWLAERRQRLRELALLTGVRSREVLDHAGHLLARALG